MFLSYIQSCSICLSCRKITVLINTKKINNVFRGIFPGINLFF